MNGNEVSDVKRTRPLTYMKGSDICQDPLYGGCGKRSEYERKGERKKKVENHIKKRSEGGAVTCSNLEIPRGQEREMEGRQRAKTVPQPRGGGRKTRHLLLVSLIKGGEVGVRRREGP